MKKRILSCLLALCLVLMMGPAGIAAHVHTDECYLVTQLTCGRQEAEAHEHDESCWSVAYRYGCGQYEGEAHTHTDWCYSTELVCDIPEHIHVQERNSACFDDGYNVICGYQEHSHYSACYETRLICGIEQEGVVHHHSDACLIPYLDSLICGKEETEGHKHTQSCYTTVRYDTPQCGYQDSAANTPEPSTSPIPSPSVSPSPSPSPNVGLDEPSIPPAPPQVESPIQDVVKEQPYTDWIERIDVPEYAAGLYDVLVAGSKEEQAPGLTDCLIRDSFFVVDPNAKPGTANHQVIQSEEVSVSLAELYASGADPASSIDSMIFTDDSFNRVDVTASDRSVDYPSLKLGQVVQTGSFNGVFVTSVANGSDYDEVKKEVVSYIGTIFHAFDRDHPEIFWLSGKMKAKMVTILQGNTQRTYFFLVLADNSGFTMRAPAWDKDGAVASGIQRRDKAVAGILASLSGSEVQKLSALNQWLTHHNEYNRTEDLTTIGNEPHECLSALEGRTGTDGPVCDGYSRAFKVICDRLGIPCVLENGYAKATADSTPGFHMWNSVRLDGSWYGVDVTWNDPVVRTVSKAVSGKENENYFLVGSDTVIRGLAFKVSHPATNQAAVGGVAFNNGPSLSPVAYSAAVVPAQLPFDDIPANAWYLEAAQYVYDNGIMSGTSGSKFSPKAYTTRGMVMTMLARYAGEDTTGSDPWYSKGMDWSVRTGVSDGTAPNKNVSREQLVTMLYRYAGSPNSAQGLGIFSDARTVSPWAQDAMAWAVEKGIITGNGNRLDPGRPASRAEVATIMMRFCQAIG